ncbi:MULTISPECIES: oligosaccharide flippase family protein [Colwellia]|uniref:Lipopolysaccharide biosynthesis protein n=1 Tax=Colwellia marinimaniae TaxID=1513592 RepID=A0ABQ0MVA3_9GAMM|nr:MULTISPECIES: oligosaccharide flippase family protein [Colwellia]GAW95531.1 lipopolysaccharide biosynthesis protein [Colwellia marinimaniae]
MSKATKTLLGAITLVADAILKRLIGLISTLILARILAPEDFGLIAIAMIVIGFASVLSVTGSEQYILQKDTVNDDILNSAWTLDLLLKAGVFIILLVSAPYVADFYQKEELTGIIRAISFLVILGALGNPGILLFKREQKYKAIFKISLISKVISVIVTITIAVVYQNYWALIIGHLVSVSTRIIGTYFIHNHRPRLCFTKIKEQWRFSAWMMPQACLGYLRTQLDTFLVSNFYGEKQLGSYHIMKYIAFMPSSELIAPATSPLLAELAKSRNNIKDFRYQFNLSFLVTLAVALPMAIFLFQFDYLVVGLLLGDQWLPYSNLFGYMALLGIAVVLLHQSIRVLIVFEKTKLVFYYELVAFISLYGTLLSIGIEDINTFTMVRVLMENCFCIVLFLAVAYYILKKQLWYLLTLIFPLLASVFIATFLSGFFLLVETHLILEIIIRGGLFVVAYILSLVGSYLVFYNKTEEGRHISHLLIKQLTQLQSIVLKR